VDPGVRRSVTADCLVRSKLIVGLDLRSRNACCRTSDGVNLRLQLIILPVRGGSQGEHAVMSDGLGDITGPMKCDSNQLSCPSWDVTT
jgi:hypothetical protein